MLKNIKLKFYIQLKKNKKKFKLLNVKLLHIR